MVAAETAESPDYTVTFDPPTTVFTLDRDIADFDVSPDGQRFLVQLTPPSDFLPYPVMVNWRAVMRGAVR